LVGGPRKGKPGPARREHERRPGFSQLIKWRTGAEGRISHLKHAYGWDRGRLDSRQRTATWCRHGILAHKLVKITRLAAAEPA
jgi:IS5 family transposase